MAGAPAGVVTSAASSAVANVSTPIASPTPSSKVPLRSCANRRAAPIRPKPIDRLATPSFFFFAVTLTRAVATPPANCFTLLIGRSSHPGATEDRRLVVELEPVGRQHA